MLTFNSLNSTNSVHDCGCSHYGACGGVIKRFIGMLQAKTSISDIEHNIPESYSAFLRFLPNKSMNWLCIFVGR